MMHKEDIMKEIASLQTVSPGYAKKAFVPIKAAVEAFFTPDKELEKYIEDCIFQVAFNYEYRHIIYENQDVMPPFSDKFPTGYDDVRVLFEAGGVWKEIKSIQEETFVRAFEYKSSETGNVAVNPFLDDWTVRIEAARAKIVPDLQTIISFCELEGTNNGLAVYFEEHGMLVSSPTRRETAKRVYIDGGYMEVIQAYGLGVHIPSYYRS